MMKHAALFLFAMLSISPAIAAARGGAEKPSSQSHMSAKDALDTFGICAHLGRTTPESAANTAKMLSYIGINNVRYDLGTTANTTASDLNALIGTKYNGLFASATSYEAKRDFVQANLSMFTSVEGLNEANGKTTVWNGLPVYEAERAFMSQLYADFSSSVPVFSSTLALNTTDEIYSSIVNNYKPWTADYLSTHIYPITWNKSVYNAMRDKIALDAPLSPGKIQAFTEIGAYSVSQTGDRGTNKSAVTQEVQAKHNINSLFSGFILGNKKTYLYELVDNSDDPTFTDSEQHFGQFHYDLTPKLSATAIQTAVNVLRDTAQARTVDLNYSTSGETSSVKKIVLQKSNGTHIIAIWNDVDMWDNANAVEVVTQAVPISLSFDTSKKISIFDPITGSTPTVQNGSTFEIDVPDHVILIKVEPVQ